MNFKLNRVLEKLRVACHDVFRVLTSTPIRTYSDSIFFPLRFCKLNFTLKSIQKFDVFKNKSQFFFSPSFAFESSYEIVTAFQSADHTVLSRLCPVLGTAPNGPFLDTQ